MPCRSLPLERLVTHPDPRRPGEWDVDDVLTESNQLLSQQTAEAWLRAKAPAATSLAVWLLRVASSC